MKSYEVEKWVWTEAEFETMGWHDSRIHALAFFPDDFDIDYILQWVHPEADKKVFKFWVSPSTLVFENVYDIEFDTGSNTGELDILSIKREEARPPRNAHYIGKDSEWLWIIELMQGEIRFRSVGYKQYIRTAPVFGKQVLELKSRGLSFTRGKTA